jgi:hypothetical protein
MYDHPLSPKNYAIENVRWAGQLVSVEGEDAIVGSYTCGGTHKVHQACTFYLPAADHRHVVEARVQKWFRDIPRRAALPWEK